ncbi:TPA: hypothetical protein ACGO1T_000597 [Streptococcus suis]
MEDLLPFVAAGPKDQEGQGQEPLCAIEPLTGIAQVGLVQPPASKPKKYRSLTRKGETTVAVNLYVSIYGSKRSSKRLKV